MSSAGNASFITSMNSGRGRGQGGRSRTISPGKEKDVKVFESTEKKKQ
jgi:hypothetical protein